MFSSGSGHFRSLHYGDGGNQGGGHGNLGSHREASLDQSRGYRDAGGGHSESVDVVSSVVNSLHHIVGINVLVAASGHSESVLCFRSGRVDVLVAKAELTKLVLGVELAGWRLNNGSCGSDGGEGKRLGKGGGGGNQERLLDGERLGKGLSGERKRGMDWSRKDEGLVSESYWSWNHGGLDQDWRYSEDWSSGNSIAGLNSPC